MVVHAAAAAGAGVGVTRGSTRHSKVCVVVLRGWWWWARGVWAAALLVGIEWAVGALVAGGAVSLLIYELLYEL